MQHLKPILPILGLAMVLALILSPFASSWPDGLEKVAETLGFAHRAAQRPVLQAPLSDYSMPQMEGSFLSTPLAGVLGTLLCFLLPFGFYLLRKK
jgi:cobalt/nickel transport protein